MAKLVIKATEAGEAGATITEGDNPNDVTILLPLQSGHLLTRSDAEKLVYFFANEYPPTKVN